MLCKGRVVANEEGLYSSVVTFEKTVSAATNMLPPTVSITAPVPVDPLSACMAPGGIDAPPLYFLGAVIASIENIEKKQTGNRWNHLRTTKFPTIEILRIGGTNAVDEPTLRMILPFLKNTENKRIAMSIRGMQTIQEIVFHGFDGVTCKIEVQRPRLIMSPLRPMWAL